MIEGNHVYTLNHDLKVLQQKYENDSLTVVKASPNYQINESKKLHEYKMVESVDDLIEIFKTTEDENKLLI